MNTYYHSKSHYVMQTSHRALSWSDLWVPSLVKDYLAQLLVLSDSQIYAEALQLSFLWLLGTFEALNRVFYPHHNLCLSMFYCIIRCVAF